MALLPYMVKRYWRDGQIGLARRNWTLQERILNRGDRLLNYWPMTELTGGNTFTATKGGIDLAAVNVTMVAGQVDGQEAANYNGVDAYAYSKSSIDFSARKKIVIAGLFRFPTYPADKMAFEFGPAITGSGRFNFITSSGGYAKLSAYGDIGYNLQTYLRPIIDEWHFLAFEYDFDQVDYETMFYADGIGCPRYAATYTNNNTNYLANAVLNIGSRNKTGSYCPEIIQHLAIYTDLSEDEIWSDYIYSFKPSFAGYKRHRIINSVLQSNITTRKEFPCQSNLASLKINTDARYIKVTGTCTCYGVSSTYSFFIVKKDGVYHSTLSFTANETKTFDVDLGDSGVEKEIEIVNGWQGNRDGSFLDHVLIEDGASYEILPQRDATNIVLLGDSITAGRNSTYPATQGMGKILESLGWNVFHHAWGNNSIFEVADTDLKRTITTEKVVRINPDVVVINLGVNDYNGSLLDTPDFQSKYHDLLVSILAANETVVIIVFTPIIKGSEGPNSYGKTLGNYRTAEEDAASGLGRVLILNGQPIVSLPLSPDGIHPTTEQLATIGNAIHAFLIANGFEP